MRMQLGGQGSSRPFFALAAPETPKKSGNFEVSGAASLKTRVGRPPLGPGSWCGNSELGVQNGKATSHSSSMVQCDYRNNVNPLGPALGNRFSRSLRPKPQNFRVFWGVSGAASLKTRVGRPPLGPDSSQNQWPKPASTNSHRASSASGAVG
jgi:hypothetical protein